MFLSLGKIIIVCLFFFFPFSLFLSVLFLFPRSRFVWQSPAFVRLRLCDAALCSPCCSSARWVPLFPRSSGLWSPSGLGGVVGTDKMQPVAAACRLLHWNPLSLKGRERDKAELRALCWRQKGKSVLYQEGFFRCFLGLSETENCRALKCCSVKC